MLPGNRVAIDGYHAIGIWDLSSKQQVQSIRHDIAPWSTVRNVEIFSFPQTDTNDNLLLVCHSDPNGDVCYVDAWTEGGVSRYRHTIRKRAAYATRCDFRAVKYGDQLLVLGQDQVLHFVDAHAGTESRANKLRFYELEHHFIDQLIGIFLHEDLLFVHTGWGLYAFDLTDCSRKHYYSGRYERFAQSSDDKLVFQGLSRGRGTIETIKFASDSARARVRFRKFRDIPRHVILSVAKFQSNFFLHASYSPNVVVYHADTQERQRILDLPCDNQIISSAMTVSEERNELLVALHDRRRVLAQQHRVMAFCLSEPRSS